MHSIKFQVQIMLCQPITFPVFTEVPMSIILKNIFRKSFFQKSYVLMLAIFVSIRKQNKHYKRRIENCTIVESTVAQAPIRQLYKHRFDGCTSINLAVTKASVRRLSIEPTIVQASNRRLQSSSRRLY